MYWYILGLFLSECQSLLPVTIGWSVLPWEFYCCASLSFDHLPTIAKAQVMTCWWRQVGSSTKGSYFHAEHSTISQKLQGLCFQWFSEACRLQRAILHRKSSRGQKGTELSWIPLKYPGVQKNRRFLDVLGWELSAKSCFKISWANGDFFVCNSHVLERWTHQCCVASQKRGIVVAAGCILNIPQRAAFKIAFLR